MIMWTRYHIEAAIQGCKDAQDDISLCDLEFYGLDLRGVDFTECRLWKTRFEECLLHNANFTGADLSDASFDICKLDGANLTSTSLNRTLFQSCTLADVIFSGTYLGTTIFVCCSGIAYIYLHTLSSRNDKLVAVVHTGNEVYLKAGCWWGTLGEFIARVTKEYSSLHDYIPVAQLLAAWLREEPLPICIED